MTSRSFEQINTKESRHRIKEKIYAFTAVLAEHDRVAGSLNRSIAATLACLDNTDDHADPEEAFDTTLSKIEHQQREVALSFLEVEQTLTRLQLMEHYFRRFSIIGHASHQNGSSADMH